MLQQSAATPVDLAVVCVAMTDQVAAVSTSVLASIEKRDGRGGWVALEPGDQTSPRELSTGTAQGLHEKLRAGGCSIKISAGGSGANTLRMFAWLSHANSSCFLSAVGTDESGSIFLNVLREEGLDSVLPVRTGATGGAHILVPPNGDRIIVFDDDTALKRLATSADEVGVAFGPVLRQSRVAYLTGWLCAVMGGTARVAFDLAGANTVVATNLSAARLLSCSCERPLFNG